MKNKKEYMIIFVTVAALLMDILGREFAVKFVLPVWTDSIGTFLVAYLYGPVCGAFVGFTNNIVLSEVCLALLWGFIQKRESLINSLRR